MNRVYVDGLLRFMVVLAVFGIIGVVALIFWVIPNVWQWIKPWLHSITG